MGIDHIPQEGVVFTRTDGRFHDIDHLSGIGAMQGATQYGSGFCVHYGLEHTRGFTHQPGAGDGCRRKDGNLDVEVFVAGGLFREPHATERGVHEYGIRGIAVAGDALALSVKGIPDDAEVVQRNVRELRAAFDVAESPDMRNGGLQAFVHGNRALFRCLHASGFKVEPRRERAAARREQDGIRGQRLFRAVENETDLGFIPGVAYGTGGCTGYDRYALVFQRLADAVGHIGVFAGKEAGTAFQYGDP